MVKYRTVCSHDIALYSIKQADVESVFLIVYWFSGSISVVDSLFAGLLFMWYLHESFLCMLLVFL